MNDSAHQYTLRAYMYVCGGGNYKGDNYLYLIPLNVFKKLTFTS